MPIGSYKFAVAPKQHLTAVWWRDQRDVYATSTLHKKTVSTVLNRPNGSKDKQNMHCPQMIMDHTYHMGGVDLTDQYVSYYSMTKRKTLKWWGKVFWHLLDVCIVNAWIIYRINFHPQKSTARNCFVKS